MSVEATSDTRDLPANGIFLEPRPRFVLYALANYADPTGVCWPSYKTLGGYTGYSRASVIRSINELIELGLIAREARQRQNGSDTSNVYRLTYVRERDNVVAPKRSAARVESHADTPPVSHRHPPSISMTPPELSLELPIEPSNKVKDKEQILVENENANELTPPLSATPTRVNNQQLLEIWNQHCGVLPRTLKLNAKRGAALNRLRTELGDQTADMLRAATLQVASDEYWIEKGYGFDNLLRDGRVVEKAEKYAAYGTMASSDRRMANTAMTIMRAIGVDHVN
jgi:hypothetical protein